MGLGGWWWLEVKVECAPAAQQENAPVAQQSMLLLRLLGCLFVC